MKQKMILQLHNVKTLSGLNRLSFWVGKGEIIGLVLINQYGIDSLVKLLTEKMVPNSGKVEFNAHAAIIDRDIRLIGEMSIAENLFVLNKKFKMSILKPYEIQRACQIILDEFELDLKAGDSATDLTFEQRIQLELIKAKLSGASLIILKDIGKLLRPSNESNIYQLIERLAAEGLAFLFMDSYPDSFFSQCSRLLIYDGGTIKKIFYPEQFTPQKLEPYLHRGDIHTLPTSPEQEILLKLNQYSLAKGQCLLIVDKEKQKLPLFLKLFLQQEPLAGWQLETSIPQPYLIPESPIDHSLYLNQSYLFNLSFGIEEKLRRQFLSKRLLFSIRKEFTKEIGDRHQYETINHLSEKELLSLVYNRALLLRPKLLIIYQPFIGIDTKLQTHILDLIQQLKKRQITVIVLTSYVAGLETVSEKIIEV